MEKVLFNRIKVVLAELELSQKDFHNRLLPRKDVGYNTVGMWCRNDSQPDIPTLNIIADVLDVSVRILLVDNKRTYRTRIESVTLIDNEGGATTPNKFNRLKVVLAELGLSNKDFHNRLLPHKDVVYNTVGMWCRNESQPDIPTLNIIADVLDISVRILLVDNKGK